MRRNVGLGLLVNGNWQDSWYETKSNNGSFKRQEAGFRNWVTKDGSPGPTGRGGYKAQSGRYHLYVSYACPWAHRTLIFRKLKGLEDHIGVSVVHPDMLGEGWTFNSEFSGATGDSLHGHRFMREVYLADTADVTTRVTVPVLWDRETGTIVSNESSEIIRMFNSAFDDVTGNTLDLWPEELHPRIEEFNDRIYSDINNGVYRAGFATSQSAYDDAVHKLFNALDWLEGHLSQNRYLLGDHQTEADWRLFTTLVRFDPVYHLHFKCNRRRLIDYKNLWAFTRELYQTPGVAETVRMDHIVRHYHYSHDTINPHRIIPINPVLDFSKPHQRDQVPLA